MIWYTYNLKKTQGQKVLTTLPSKSLKPWRNTICCRAVQVHGGDFLKSREGGEAALGVHACLNHNSSMFFSPLFQRRGRRGKDWWTRGGETMWAFIACVVGFMFPWQHALCGLRSRVKWYLLCLWEAGQKICSMKLIKNKFASGTIGF